MNPFERSYNILMRTCVVLVVSGVIATVGFMMNDIPQGVFFGTGVLAVCAVLAIVFAITDPRPQPSQ